METLSEPRMGRLDGPVVDYQFSDVICLAYDRSSPEQSHPAANMVVDLVFANAGVLIKVRVVETQHFWSMTSVLQVSLLPLEEVSFSRALVS
uniref:hypothetical protein n=1 Tax=Enterobacter cloacae complex sp. TaxID=2027919 RepID=UPI002100008A|nr:hypothetical protein [Enterobacter cloacae complex sp.]